VNSDKNTEEFITAVLVAMCGGAVHAINNKPARWCWRWFVAGIITAAFAGIVTNCILEGLGAPEKTRVALVGMAGYAAHDLLEVLKQRLLNLVKGVGQNE